MDNDTTDTTAYYTTGPASTVSFDTTSSNMVDTGAGSEQSKKERRHGGGTPKTRCERCTTKHLKCDSTSQDGASSCTHCDTAWEPCSFCPEEFKEVLAKWQKENAPAKVKKTRSSKACDECYKDKKNPKCEFLPDGSSSCTRCTKLKRSCTFQIKRQRGTWGELMGCPADVSSTQCPNVIAENRNTEGIGPMDLSMYDSGAAFQSTECNTMLEMLPTNERQGQLNTFPDPSLSTSMISWETIRPAVPDDALFDGFDEDDMDTYLVQVFCRARSMDNM
ncbi:hypothetical protein I203_101486 [Kwoniella mangroviensis CBS 8507]|uniref:uncharacterized protein n=1 Tax=Kwoniella mangroviensis CBS 8507 TaxID=1296122 RepID=UPI00302BDF65